MAQTPSAGGSPRNYHVLLIGIDLYDGDPRAWLSGCVNDIDAVQRVLIDEVGVAGDRVTRLVSPLPNGPSRPRDEGVKEGPPTLENIVAAFEGLGGEGVNPGDRVFIYYSGHGARLVIDANGTRFAREALVPQDRVVLQRRQYLFDWQLNDLLARIVERTSSVTLVLDCCCAAGVARDAADLPGSKARFLEDREPYLLPADRTAPGRDRPRGLAEGIAGVVDDIQIAAACFADQRARESPGASGVANGELTRALLKHLRAQPRETLSELRWGKIWRNVVAEVEETRSAQTPWLSGGFARKVLGSPPEEGDAGYELTRAGDEYGLRVGSLAGVTEGAEIAVYGSEPPLFDKLGPVGGPREVEARAGTLRVCHATRSTARAVALSVPFDLPPGARGRLVKAGANGRILVALSPHDRELARELGQSSLLSVAPPGTRGDVTLVRRTDGAWAVTDDVFGAGEKEGEPTLAIIEPSLRHRAAEVLEHYHLYTRALRLARASQDLPRALRVRLFDCKNAGALTPAQKQNPTGVLLEVDPAPDAPYQLRAGASPRDPAADRICIVVENTSCYDLRVALLAVQHSGKVDLLAEDALPKAPSCSDPEKPGRSIHTYWHGGNVADARPFFVTMSRPGVGVDRLVAIGTTNHGAKFDHLKTNRSFAQILDPSRPRAIGGDDDAKGPPPEPELWTGAITALRIARLA
jgi:caspase domain-containing protein